MVPLSHNFLQDGVAFAMQIKSKTEKKKDKFFTMDPQQITFDMVRQKLKDIVMTRGKRGVDRNEQVEMLTYLASVAKGPVQKIEVLIQVVSALFDINPSMSTHMSVPLWKRCAGTLLEVLQTLADNDYIEVDEAYDNPEERTEEPPAGQPAKVCFFECLFLINFQKDVHFLLWYSVWVGYWGDVQSCQARCTFLTALRRVNLGKRGVGQGVFHCSSQ